MKKLLLGILAGLCICTTGVRAEGISDGTILFDLRGGGAFGLQKSGYEIADQKDFAWGNYGGEISISALYFPSAYIGLGLELRCGTLIGSDTGFVDKRGGIWNAYNVDMETNLLHLMATSRFNINPHQKARLYIPFGAGMTVTRGTITYKHNNWDEISKSATDLSLGYYAGIGVEFDTKDNNLLWGFEARYNAFRYDINKLAHTIGDHVDNGLKNYSYLSFLISIGFKL